MSVIERNFELGKIMFNGDVERIVSVINQVKEHWSNFKIGKAGETADERFGQIDYRNTYDDICEVYASTSKQLVDAMEATLIDCFINDPKCDNSKEGDRSVNDYIKDSKRYIVYVVYKKRRVQFKAKSL